MEESLALMREGDGETGGVGLGLVVLDSGSVLVDQVRGRDSEAELRMREGSGGRGGGGVPVGERYRGGHGLKNAAPPVPISLSSS
jgi:hypothetical protein